MHKHNLTKGIIAVIVCISLLVCGTICSFAEASAKSTKEEVDAMNEKQLSSLAMLNHMTVLSQEINASSNSRLYLDNAYSEIENNLNLNAIDQDSLYQIRMLMDTIHAYQTINTKREHIKYIYEQNQAAAIKKAIPNPVSVLNVVQSGNWLKALVSVAYMAVDAKSSYDAYVSEVETKYMQDGWELDEEAEDNLHESSKDTLTYLVDMCHEHGIDDNLVLRNDSIESFVNWENNTNNTRKIDFFEKNESTYQGYGKYWLVLAESYYNQGDYKKCLDAICTYENMNIDTFKYDKGLAKIAAIAISAAKESLPTKQYIAKANHYADVILNNITDNKEDDWALRYLVAQTYADLYAQTKDKNYLQKAYDLVELNVNLLLDEQTKKNETYLNDVKKETEKSTDSKEKKEEIKNYNKWITEERKTELPPVYQPLVVNCDLLKGLANELHIDDAKRKKLDNMLHANGSTLFIVEPLETLYWFNGSKKSTVPDIKLEKNELFKNTTIRIPVSQLSLGTTLKVTVTDNGQSQVYDNWTLNEVIRDDSDKKNANKYTAVYTCKDMDKQKYSESSVIKVEIIPAEGSTYGTKTYTFKTNAGKVLWALDDIKFEQIK